MLLIIISCISLTVFILSMDLSWANVISSRRNELVFEGRNKEYGAYALRREYHMNVFYSILLSVGLIGGGFLAAAAFKDHTVSTFTPPFVRDIDDIFFPPTPPKPNPDKDDRPTTKSSTAASGASGSVNNGVEVSHDGHTVDHDFDDSGSGGVDNGPTDLVDPVDSGSGGTGSGCDGDEEKAKQRFKFVKNMPQFPGGMEEFMRYVQSRVKYTEYEVMHNVNGTMYMSFTVFPNGYVGEIIVERGITFGDKLERRVTDVLLNMPQWKPGDNGEEPVAVIMKMPLKFELRR